MLPTVKVRSGLSAIIIAHTGRMENFHLQVSLPCRAHHTIEKGAFLAPLLYYYMISWVLFELQP